ECRQALDRRPTCGHLELSGRRHCTDHGMHSAFPGCMEYRLVVLVFDRAHALHAAHVMNPVHPRPPVAGLTFAPPITASRVTSAASASSPSPSVPAGLSGRTM